MSKYRVYTPDMIEFLRLGYRSMNVRNLASAFNEKFGMEKTERQIRFALHNYKIRCGRAGKDRLREITTTIFTPEQAAFLREAYLTMPADKMTDALNEKFGTSFKYTQVKAYCYNHGIRSGRTGRFEKGQKPWNDQTRGMGLTGPNSGCFKKGNIPPSCKPLYSERISRDGSIEIKVPERNPNTGSPTRYRAKQRWLWEQRHGPIPEGMVVTFRDGDPMNCTIDNLMLASKAELLQLNRNGYRGVHNDIKPSVLALSKLQVKISEVKKEMA